MARCKQCGKQGFFLSVDKSGRCSDCVRKNKEKDKQLQQKLDKMKQDLKKQDRQIAALNHIADTYKKDKDVEKAIAAYESFFAKEEATWAYNRKMDLAELYQKVGRFNDSWGVLNTLVVECPSEIHRTRKMMYKQLKKEKRFTDALQMYVWYAYDEMAHVTCEIQDSFYDKYRKDIAALLKKIGLPEEKTEELIKIVHQNVIKKKKDEALIIAAYRTWWDKNKASISK